MGRQSECRHGEDSLGCKRSRIGVDSLGNTGGGFRWIVRGKGCCVHVLCCVVLWCFVCMLRCKDRGERLVFTGTCLQSYQLSSVTNEEING